MRVALVHDWLTGMRGGEKVLEVFCELFPDATLYTLVHVAGTTSPTIESRPIRTAFTQKLPKASSLYRWYLPLHPWAIGSLRIDDVDLVLSSSHCVAKSIRAPKGALHICYCHTPMRYVWDRFEDYFGSGVKAKLLYGPVASRLRHWDKATADRVDTYIANSNYVAERIERYYGRESAVIPPPVDTDFFVPGNTDAPPYFLIVSALVPYKRVDLAIDAFRGRKEELRIVGAGPDAARLKSSAPDNVRFLGWVDPSALRELYQGCRACLLPGVEDFGIVPLEAQASGAPVVAFGYGGALDTVRDGETGVLFQEQTVPALSRAIDKVSSLRLNKKSMRDWALGFSRETFRGRMQAFIEATIADSAR